MFEDFRLRVFKTVCQEKSFTLAAHRLDISQPAVSQNIAELERNLGFKLFFRSASEVRLTEKGQEFENYADMILHWYEVTRDVFQGRIDPLNAPQLDLGDGKTAQIWTSGGDIHIHMIND